MTFWYISDASTVFNEDGGSGFIYFPSDGLPSLARALSRDHLREWIKHLRPSAHPDVLDEETNRLWKVFSELKPEDRVLVQHDREHFSLGEVTGSYQFEIAEGVASHRWPVCWLGRNISFAVFPSLRACIGTRLMKEVNSEEARIKLIKYLPSLRTRSYVIFRWLSIIILVAELVYFWPH